MSIDLTVAEISLLIELLDGPKQISGNKPAADLERLIKEKYVTYSVLNPSAVEYRITEAGRIALERLGG